jgi:hypothetical protein
MPRHTQTIVKVNAEVDEGVARLIQALSNVHGLITQESCQGELGHKHGFVVFRLGSWRQCGSFLFEHLLASMDRDLRSGVSLRIEAYDTDYARGWITFDASVLHQLTSVVEGLAAPEGASVLMAGNAHREAVPQIITATG